MAKINELLDLINREEVGMLIDRLIIRNIYRQCLQLKYVQGHSSKEIADILCLDYKTVDRYLSKSRLKLIREIERYVRG